MTLKSRNWNAWINLMPGSKTELIVTGEVETTAGNLVPVLKEAVPQGFNPSILTLELTIERQGNFGTADVAYRNARFEKPAGQGQYDSVSIKHKGTEVVSMVVVEAH